MSGAFETKARAAWGAGVPAEIVALARAADTGTAAAAARAIGYSAAVVSHLLANRYPGDVASVLAAIRGAFMSETVLCPVLGEIGRELCLAEQRRPFSATNSTRARLFHACKTCQHSRSGRSS